MRCLLTLLTNETTYDAYSQQEKGEKLMDISLSRNTYDFKSKPSRSHLPQYSLCSWQWNSLTALDFAFSIHTEIGMKTRGARLNGKLVPLSRTLKSGEHVEIITSENIKPTANWLDFVQTSRAKSKIKSSLNDEKKIIAEDGR